MNDDPVVCATLRTTGYYLERLRREDKTHGLRAPADAGGSDKKSD